MMAENKIVSVDGMDQPAAGTARRFDFNRDRFAFANELKWAYHHDPVTGRTTFAPRRPTPAYTLRCFVLARAARQFLYHAQFDAAASASDDATYRRQIREIVSRNPRVPCTPERRVVFSGFDGLYGFSQTWEHLLKEECGGAWRSYVVRSHWRMIFPISRRHQACTAESLASHLRAGESPIIHLLRFPKLTINHGVILYDVQQTGEGLRFAVYDPNDPKKPTHIDYDAGQKIFSLPANDYWAGGRLDVIEIYRSWLL